MISRAIEELMSEKKDAMMIPAENVANVMVGNPLEHALLVLSKVGYSKIPVLDKGDRFIGLLSLNDVVNKMMDLNGIDTKNLSKYTVADVMDTEIDVVKENCDLEDIMHLLVDAAFIPVLDDDGIFKGIVTRREILKAVNHTFHELDKKHHVSGKFVLQPTVPK
ncbi:cyclic-di-AMP-binding protein CbpB [Enterococcus pallens]|uniref:CBS domain-containing protein n=1 Tax=Enterococcus pallens ATCC BAA-351 TaxID=1158607 RepID=R2RZ12_9ENTE|nr:cyclic-di-AMP-binding protein CbpB [Enterococcus pallens]EOH88490.1 CBS domain-containing protein [Enterococcus pallens ATCC BAA-351]EOU17671.1 CBS domain-containing protein [Enterococcus pallens ATCC BAA-351]OJG81546.1 CBS domain-containing protein [Enterococcus pallens]